MVVVRVAFEYLARFYAAVDISPGAEIRLLRTDGADLAHYPSAAGAPLNELGGASRAGRGSDGGQIIARQNVTGYPLVVEVRSAVGSGPGAVAATGARERRPDAGSGRAGRSAARRTDHSDAPSGRGRNWRAAASELQLQEARKAEAISLLAASVAHDFNNVLGAIVGYGELARAESDRGISDPLEARSACWPPPSGRDCWCGAC